MTTNQTQSQRVAGQQFTNVDGSNDPQGHVQYLDLVASSAGYKPGAIAALQLKPGDRVLDIGCGTGDDARQMAEIVGPTGLVVGVDSSATMIAEAVCRGQASDQAVSVEFRQGDIYHLPFYHNSFDVTRADRVFQHLTDPAAALAEMRRATRPGGVVNVVDVDWETLVLDVPNRALFRKIRGHWLDMNPSRQIGCQLYGQFHRDGLQDVRVAMTQFGVVTNYTIATQLVDVDAMAQEAFAAGALTLDEHLEWQETLSVLAESESCFLGIGLCCVSGIKP